MSHTGGTGGVGGTGGTGTGGTGGTGTGGTGSGGTGSGGTGTGGTGSGGTGSGGTGSGGTGTGGTGSSSTGSGGTGSPGGSAGGSSSTTLLKPAHIAVTPPKFSGKPDEDPFKYLQNFDLAAVSNNWDDIIKMHQIPNYLLGTASLWYKFWRRDRLVSTPGVGRPTWPEFVKALQKAFRSVASKDVAEEKLFNRKQRIGESPEDYFYSMLDLIYDYDPSMSVPTQIRFIVKGLRPVYLEKINPMKPTTIEKVLECIRSIAETQYLVDHVVDSNLTQEQSSLTKVLDNMNALFDKQTALLASYSRGTGHSPAIYPNPSRPQESSLFCNYCKAHGHWITDCPTRPPVYCRNCRVNTHTTKACKTSGNGQRRGTNSNPTPPTQQYPPQPFPAPNPSQSHPPNLCQPRFPPPQN